MANDEHGRPSAMRCWLPSRMRLVALHARYHGREPVSARTRMLGTDMLACLLGDVYTDVEKTMIELQRQALVHETRSAFQHAMQHRFIASSPRSSA